MIAAKPFMVAPRLAVGRPASAGGLLPCFPSDPSPSRPECPFQFCSVPLAFFGESGYAYPTTSSKACSIPITPQARRVGARMRGTEVCYVW